MEHGSSVTSAANNLHKAHVKYLEARLIEEARSVKRINLENGTTPSRSGLSEAAQANMESFFYDPSDDPSSASNRYVH